MNGGTQLASRESFAVKETRLPNASRQAEGQCGYNSRIAKGGALIEEMRQLVRLWSDAPKGQLEETVIRGNVLNKRTRARASDVLRRTFIPRLVEGPIPNAWKFLRPLEDAGAPPQVIKPIYYWASAKAEPMIADFVTDFLYRKQAWARGGVQLSEVIEWLSAKGCHWSDTVSTKVARGLMAALRDFGVLEGRATKRLASFHLPLASFAYLAFCFHQLGATARNLVFHPDWQLFLLDTAEVENKFLEAHQQGLLEYYAAGSVVNLSFPIGSPEEYARVVVGRSNQAA